VSRAAELRLLERTGTLFAQLFFIAAGVYLGNQADAWKEQRNHREAARATLANFRAELAKNRDAVAREASYHADLARSFLAITRDPAGPPRSLNALFERVGWHGSGPIGFRHTAWDLALANQSLGYLDQRLAFAVADVYLQQQKFDEYQANTQRAALIPASLRPDALGGLSVVLWVFYTDASGSIEPALTRQYGALLPKLDTAIARLSK